MYDNKQIAFILYNNRSVEGTVSNFLKRKNFSAEKLIEVEDMLDWCNSLYSDEQTVAVDRREMDLESPDVTVTPEMLDGCLDAVLKAHAALLDGGPELDWLMSRGITHRMCRDMKLGSLNYIAQNHPEMLVPLGISIHPMLKPILSDDVSDGGVLIPLLRRTRHKTWVFQNCTTRRISDVGKLKYTQACPDLDVWGLGGSGEYWVTEGLFDAAAIRWSEPERPRLAASVSSAMWSGPQLLQLIQLANRVNIFADNDKVGLRSAAVLQRFFGMNGLECGTYVSRHVKDPAEHFLEKKLGWSDVVEVEITRDMISASNDMTFNFTKYLKNRTF